MLSTPSLPPAVSAMPIRVFDVQVVEIQVIGLQPAAFALVRASGQASSVPPWKNASASPEARLVICDDTSVAPGAYFSTFDTVMSVPSIALLKPSS